jgi:hypothetical protein
MQDHGYGLPRIHLPETVWKVAGGFLIACVSCFKRARWDILALFWLLATLQIEAYWDFPDSLSRGSFAKRDFGASDGRRSRMRTSVPPTPGGCHVPTALPVRPLRPRVGHSPTAALLSRKARPSAEVAAQTRRGRRLLPAQEWVFVADAAARVSALADGLLPLAASGG